MSVVASTGAACRTQESQGDISIVIRNYLTQCEHPTGYTNALRCELVFSQTFIPLTPPKQLPCRPIVAAFCLVDHMLR